MSQNQVVNKENQIKKRGKGLVFMGISFALLIGTVVSSIMVSSKGSQLVFLENEIHESVEMAKEAKSKLIVSTALTEVAVKAHEIGMIKAQKTVYLTSENETIARLP